MSAVKLVSPVQFGILRHRGENFANDVDAHMVRSKFQPRDLPMDEAPFRATQTRMNPVTVRQYVEHPSEEDTRGYSDRPEIIRSRGENIIWNGHHRVAAAMQRGDKTIRVDYQDLDDG